jgi:hypothetical protein
MNMRKFEITVLVTREGALRPFRVHYLTMAHTFEQARQKVAAQALKHKTHQFIRVVDARKPE